MLGRLAQRAAGALVSVGGNWDGEPSTGFSAAGLRAVGMEAVCATAALTLYPLGLLPQRAPAEQGFRPEETTPATASCPPVLLVHGFLGNRSIFTVLARALRRQGHSEVHAVNFSPLAAATLDIGLAAQRIALEVDRLRKRTGQQRVHVVGHSLGGLIARYHVQRLGGHEVVDTLVTIGTPHRGTTLVQLAPPTRLARQLRPDSDLITDLAGPAPNCRTRFITLWSRQDQLIIPRDSARLEHPDLAVETIEVPDAGHLSLIVRPKAIRAVAQSLMCPDRITGTVADGEASSGSPWDPGDYQQRAAS